MDLVSTISFEMIGQLAIDAVPVVDAEDFVDVDKAAMDSEIAVVVD